MKVTIEELPKSEVKLCVTLPPERFERCYSFAVRNAAKKVTLPGFRKGRAPENLVEKEVGENTLLQDTINLAIEQSLPEALKENKVDALGRPEITVVKSAMGNEFEYTATVAVFPEVKLGDYKAIKGELKPVKVAAKDIESQLEELRGQRAVSITVDRAAKKEDIAEVDFCVRIDGAKIEGGESKKHPVTLGEKRFIPGFEEKLVGAKSGDDLKFELDFPKDYHAKQYAGKTAEFTVHVHTIQERQLPELNDEFAKQLGQFTSLEDLKSKVEENLEAEAKQKAQQTLREELIEQVSKGIELDLPELLVESEIDRMIYDFEQRVQSTGGNFDDYLQSIQKTREDLRKDTRKGAEKRVATFLILRAVLEAEKIDATDAEIDVEFSKALAQYPNAEEVKKQLDEEKMKASIKDQVLNEKLFKFLEETALANSKKK